MVGRVNYLAPDKAPKSLITIERSDYHEKCVRIGIGMGWVVWVQVFPDCAETDLFADC